MIGKWYRGHDGKQKPTDNFGIIWLADNPEYAQLYADEYGEEGVVSIFYIDESKLNCADTYYNDDFDVYDPDMKEVKEYQKEGYNCYTFPVELGDTDVLALFDESAIIKIETYNKKIKESIMKLTQNDFNYIISESTKRILSEISWGVANDAKKNSDDSSNDLDFYFSNFQTSAQDMIDVLNGMDPSGYDMHHPRPSTSQGAMLAEQLKTLLEKINDFVVRKKSQAENLSGHEKDKWKQAFGDKSYDEVANNITKKWEDHFEDDDFVPWEKYRQNALSKDEQDFNDRNP